MGARLGNAFPNQCDFGTIVQNEYNSDLDNVPDDEFMFGVIGSGINLTHSPFGNHAQYAVHFPSPYHYAMQLIVDADGSLAARVKDAGEWNDTWNIFKKQ